MLESVQLPQSVIDAFHLMWDGFPEPVQLNHKSRRIMAVNKAAAAMGLAPNLFCNKLGHQSNTGAVRRTSVWQQGRRNMCLSRNPAMKRSASGCLLKATRNFFSISGWASA